MSAAGYANAIVTERSHEMEWRSDRFPIISSPMEITTAEFL
ncbi:MAG: hypothetical protein PUP90_26850 [Nostoc sp. S4]|nr:hypothetical protein [Nostoc sp. S4]